ncbi:MAG: hypothetical protein COA36_17345 [Desulfotalea sp.]|nr:MAG: hypothetical protein COA36_17345 [Desulfotalea sp.]
MQIICCSSDEQLLERLIALYGIGNVVGMPDVETLGNSSGQEDEIVIVDLKFHSLPASTHYTAPVVVLTAVPTFPEACDILQQGVRGYGNRQMRAANLKQVIENVKDGQIWLPPSIISKLIDVVGRGESTESKKIRDKVLSALSKRETEVALFVAKGMSNMEVADKMYVSLRTVKAHLSSIYDKTGVRNRLELGLALV